MNNPAVAIVLMWASLVGCYAPRGGWDVDALAQQVPTIKELEGQRLGDMIPFPAFDAAGDQVFLIACRYSGDREIRVRGDGPGWSKGWADRAITAIDDSSERFELAPRSSTARDLEKGDALSEIRIHGIDAADVEGPSGLADTLTECDVSSKAGGEGSYHGLLVGSDIRIRRNRLDVLGEARAATAAEWVGALMHELGHALGFSGHASGGDSILVREQSRLRAAGRQALAGNWHFDATLDALYQIPPGLVLGRRPLSAQSMETLRVIQEWVERDEMATRRSVAVRASVGDREARVQWRLGDGSRLGVRMLHWRDELRSGGELTLVPDRQTRLRWADSPNPAESFVD